MNTALAVAIAGIVIALIQALTAWFVWKGQRHQEEANANILKIEKATNSMKDALVAATDRAAHAVGLAEGKKYGEAKAAAKAEGVAEGKKSKS